MAQTRVHRTETSQPDGVASEIDERGHNRDGVETRLASSPSSLDAIPGEHWDHEPLMRKTLPSPLPSPPGEGESSADSL